MAGVTVDIEDRRPRAARPELMATAAYADGVT
jgi:hypothetical protein